LLYTVSVYVRQRFDGRTYQENYFKTLTARYSKKEGHGIEDISSQWFDDILEETVALYTVACGMFTFLGS